MICWLCTTTEIKPGDKYLPTIFGAMCLPCGKDYAGQGPKESELRVWRAQEAQMPVKYGCRQCGERRCECGRCRNCESGDCADCAQDEREEFERSMALEMERDSGVEFG